MNELLNEINANATLLERLSTLNGSEDAADAVAAVLQEDLNLLALLDGAMTWETFNANVPA